MYTVGQEILGGKVIIVAINGRKIDIKFTGIRDAAQNPMTITYDGDQSEKELKEFAQAFIDLLG